MDYSLPEKRFRTTDGFIPLSLRPDKPSRWNTKTGKPGSSAYRVQASICVGLHVLLILAHVGLLFICFGHYEHSVTFAITSVTLEWYPMIATTFMQVLGTVSCQLSSWDGFVLTPYAAIPRRVSCLYPSSGFPKRLVRPPDPDCSP